MLAVMARHAIEHQSGSDLARDHGHAQKVAKVARSLGFRILNGKVESNMLFLDSSATGFDMKQLGAALKEQGFLTPSSEGCVDRWVFHRDVTPEKTDALCKALYAIIRKANKP